MPANFCLGEPLIQLVSQYYNIAIGFAIILSMLMIIIGGYQLVVSIGNPGIIEKGKKRIFNAILGLGIAIVSFVLLNWLNPQIFAPNATCTSGTSGQTSIELNNGASHEA